MRKFSCIARKTDGGQVVDQGIEPDIDDVLLVAWKSHAPSNTAGTQLARHRKIAQSLSQQAQHFRTPDRGHDKLWMLRDVRQQTIAVPGKREEVVLFLQPFGC